MYLDFSADLAVENYEPLILNLNTIWGRRMVSFMHRPVNCWGKITYVGAYYYCFTDYVGLNSTSFPPMDITYKFVFQRREIWRKDFVDYCNLIHF